METKLEFISGHYRPSFFRIHLDTNTRPENIEGSDEESTFLHEYIHFLQDISTVFGTLNLSFRYNLIRAAAERIRENCWLSRIHLPIDISQYANLIDSARINAALFGDTSNINLTQIAGLQENPRLVSGISVPEYRIVVSPVYTYQLGFRDVMESMAWAIQSVIYPLTPHPSDLPYNSISLLLDHFAPRLQAPDNRYLVALCEIALSTSDPISFIVSILKSIQSSGYHPANLQAFCNYLTAGLSFVSRDLGNFNNHSAATSHFIELAHKETQVMFRNSHLLEPQAWADYVFTQTLQISRQNPLIMTSGVISSNPRNYFFNLIKNQIGCPIIFNNAGIAFTYPQPGPTSGLSYFPAFEQMADLLLGDPSSGCFLQNFCQKSIKDGLAKYSITERCRKDPWNKHKDKTPCMLSKLWRGYSLGRRRYFV